MMCDDCIHAGRVGGFGQAAGLAEAVDRLLVAESIITIRSMAKEGMEE